MHVLITGASSGLGEEMAKAFARAGHNITLLARRAEQLERVREEIKEEVNGIKAVALSADLEQLASLNAIAISAEAQNGPIDCLVHNAAVEMVDFTDAIDFDEAEKLIRINLLAPLKLTRAILPGMLERGRGTLVHISSVAAYAPPPLQTHYSATKAGLAIASLSLSSELRRKGVHVLTVYPGPLRGAMSDRVLAQYGRNPSKGLPWGKPEELARRVVEAVDKRKSTLVYPKFYWLPKWFPGLTQWVMKASGRVDKLSNGRP